MIFLSTVIAGQKEVLGDGSALPVPVALSFDEMTLHRTIQFHQGEQKIFGPHDQVQVVMIRGLFKPFKQPIFFAFDTPLTKELLWEILGKLDGIGFSVESVTSDMGPKNMSLWRDLNIHPGNTNFLFNGRQLNVLADVPHLLKLLRNHLLDQGFILKSGEVILREHLEKILATDTGELRITHKLKPLHFSCTQSQRQNVALAAQLLSRSTACALRLIDPEKEEQASFVELINNAFDILNSRCGEGHKQFDYALGWETPFKKFESQKSMLLKAKEEIGGMRIIDKKVLLNTGKIQPVKSLLPFQKGWVISIESSLALLSRLKEKYQAKFIMTSRLNQDIVENLFSRMRYMGGANTHPGCVEFMNRLRLLILGQSSELIVETASVRPVEGKEDKETDLMLSQKIVEGIGCNDVSDIVISDPELGAEVIIQGEDAVLDCSSEALKYLAGYVAHKFKDRYPELSQQGSVDPPISCPWIDTYSYGGLTKPSQEWLEQYERIEGEFNNFHGNGIQKDAQIIEKFGKHLVIKFPTVSKDILKFCSKMRTHIRIKYLRTCYKSNFEQKKNQKKMKHFTT